MKSLKFMRMFKKKSVAQTVHSKAKSGVEKVKLLALSNRGQQRLDLLQLQLRVRGRGRGSPLQN